MLVKCHANCRQSEVILALRKLGLWPVDANHERKPPVGVKRSTPGIFIDGSTDRVSARAIELWRDASHIVDTPVADYLGSRGLRQAMLLDLHHVLRFTAACPFQLESGATVRLPAMLALFRHVRSNEPRAIHRTALRPDGLGKSQHPGLGATKRMLGPVAGCAIKLTPDADVLHGLGVVEGIETGLSVLCAGWSPIWVLGSAGAVADFVPLPGLEFARDLRRRRRGRHQSRKGLSQQVAGRRARVHHPRAATGRRRLERRREGDMTISSPADIFALARKVPDDPKPGQFFSAADLAGRAVPERFDLVPGVIPARTVAFLSGDGAAGKSLIGLQLAVAAAAGRKWLGRRVTPGPAIVVSAEDDRDEVHRRLVAITRHEGLSFNELSGLHIRTLVGEDLLLATSDRQGNALITTPLFAEIERFIAQVRPVIVILDNRANFFCGNENDRAQVQQFVGFLLGIAIRNDTTIVLLTHPSSTGLTSGTGTSGSTAWSNAARSRLYLERIKQESYEPDPDARRLEVKKANYGRVGEEITMKWRDGVFVADEPETGLERTLGNAKAERVFLKILTCLTQQGRYVSHKTGPTYAPAVFANHPEAEGVSKRAFSTAMETLFAQNKIAIEKHGTSSRERSHIVPLNTIRRQSDEI